MENLDRPRDDEKKYEISLHSLILMSNPVLFSCYIRHWPNWVSAKLSRNSVPKIVLSSSGVPGSFSQVFYNLVDKIQTYEAGRSE